MRDLINIILAESTGLTGRKPGDIFRNSEGDTITFVDIKLYPEGGGQYTKEELDDAIAQATGGKEIVWSNTRSARTGGFSIAQFDDVEGNPLYSGTYLQRIKPDPTENYVPNEFGDYKFKGKAAEKTQAGLSPQDLISQPSDLSVSDIMNQLAEKLGTDHPLYSVAHRVAMGEGPREGNPIEFPAPEDISFSAFRDYFCEILQPIALQRGCYTGNAADAAEKFLGSSLADTVISFGGSKTEGLQDSKLTTPDGQLLKISTKGGKGAEASVKNLVDGVAELEETPDGRKVLKKYSKEIDIIRNIVRGGQNGAPLYLAVKYDIISEGEADQIRMLRSAKPINMKNLDEVDITPRLKKFAIGREADNPQSVNLYYHLIAVIAHKAAEHVNEHTNFSSAATDILNNGALVQVYTKATQGARVWTLREFNTVWPGKSIRGVYLSAKKNYFSTMIKGNFTFIIDKGDSKAAKKAESPAPQVDTDLATAASRIVGEPTVTQKTRKIGDVGRQKR